MNDFIKVLVDTIFKPKRLIPYFFTFILAVSFTLFFIDFIEGGFSSASGYRLFIIIIAGSALFMIISVVDFLKDKQTEPDTYMIVDKFKDVKAEIDINKKLSEYITSNLTVKEVEKLVYEKTMTNLEVHLIEKLDNKYKDIAKSDVMISSINSGLVPLEKNVEKYIDRLQRNSIVNLLIGIIGTITAITILSVTILSTKEFKTPFDFSIYFLPRVTFVIFIQVFAFFFLRLYKNNLEDAKYFQNELTNINCKTASIKIAQMLGRIDKLDELLKELSIVERNFKLTKDETLIGIERARIEKDIDLDMLATFKDFLKTYKKE